MFNAQLQILYSHLDTYANLYQLTIATLKFFVHCQVNNSNLNVTKSGN